MGLHVDEVLGIYEVAAGELSAPLEAIEAATVSFIEAEFDHEGRVFCAIDAAAIMRALEEREGGGPDDGSPEDAGNTRGP